MKERIERLRGILSQLDNIMVCSDNTIETIEGIINAEYMNEHQADPPYDIYFNDIRLTKERELRDLLNNKSKPRKKVEYFNVVIRNLRQDIQKELDRIEVNSANP